MKNKVKFRLEAKKIKRDIDFKDISQIIQQKLYNDSYVKNAECILLYMALTDEIDMKWLSDKLEHDGKCCCFPVVDGENLVIKNTNNKPFVYGAFGILEPDGEVVSAESIDVVIVPGVMYDTMCRRLGRGGGYYDRFLNKVDAYKIGVCPDLLLVESVPAEIHDINVDKVITEKREINNGR